jgi:NADH dehydrogenase
MQRQHRVVIVGGGFGGLNVARKLKHAPAEVTLIDRRNFHLFQPLLYQVATGGLSPANIAAPLRAVLKGQENVEVLLGEVAKIDAANRQVILRDARDADGLQPEPSLPSEIEFDTLIVATGVSHQYFGHDSWEKFAPGLKTIEDATAIRRRLFTAFEQAERESDPAAVRAWLTFAIVGAGPTGVELSGALCELAHETLKGNFRRINPADAEVILIEAADRLLPTYPPSLSAKALASLEKLGTLVRLNTRVIDIQRDHVAVETGPAGAAQSENIATHTVLWAAGVQASPLGKAIAEATGATLDRAGRVIVQPDCSLPTNPNIFVIGDLAHFAGADSKPLPGVAQTAIQQGRYVGKLIAARLAGKTQPPFKYRDMGNLATIGRHAAVADIGPFKISGWLAWWIWLVIHLLNIVQHTSRILVLIQWGSTYFTRNRAARLITEVPDRKPI